MFSEGFLLLTIKGNVDAQISSAQSSLILDMNVRAHGSNVGVSSKKREKIRSYILEKTGGSCLDKIKMLRRLRDKHWESRYRFIAFVFYVSATAKILK